jgi:rhodanese-related sulfurtransferase
MPKADMIDMTPKAARNRLHEDDEIAFLDIREPGQFIEGHPLWAIPLPYSVLELKIAQLVPRRSDQIILCDNADGVAERAAGHLKAMGYNDVCVLQGGVPAWIAAGLPVFRGVNVPSKILGELAEQVWHPKTLNADAVATLTDSTAATVFDARPETEHAKMRVPHSVCIPNGELAHRIEAAPIAPDTPLIITCAGRTRGIIGAISMRLAGFEGQIATLENGTQGWALSGRPLERGASPAVLPALTTAQLTQSRVRGKAMRERFDLPQITLTDAAEKAHNPDLTTFVFDLRSATEATECPLHGIRQVPGVQLVQATDQYVGVRPARIILCCDTGLRSTIAAFWLRQLGYTPEVVVLDDEDHWPIFPPPPGAELNLAQIPADQVTTQDILVDIRSSGDFLEGHIDGARWAIRPDFAPLRTLNTTERLVLIADSAGVANLFAADARTFGFQNVVAVKGGMDALRLADFAVVSQPDALEAHDRIDFPAFVHDRHDGNMDAARRYLAWETGLVAQLDTTDRAAFLLTTDRMP